MHVVALNQFYAPDRSATAQLLTELAEGLVGRGHRVTVVTSGPRFSSALRDARVHEQRAGVDVIRIPSTHFGKHRLATRAADYASFYLGATRALSTLPERPDVFLPLTTPPMVALAAQLAAVPMRVPVVALVQDLYPDVAVRLRVIASGGPIHRAWAAVAGASLRHAAAVVALSEPMADHLRAYGVAPERLEVIPNWALAELEGPPPVTGGAQARLEYGLGERFVVMYSGNLGASHQFETLLATARRLRDRGDIAFVFVGEGVRKPEVERFARREGLENVRVLPLAPREHLAESLAAADLHVITLRDGLEGLVVPSKLYGVLAAARPAIFIGPARDSAAATLREAQAGLTFENGDVSGVAQAVVSLAADRERAVRMGQRGRAHLLAVLSRERALDAYERVLARVSHRASGRAATSPHEVERERGGRR